MKKLLVGLILMGMLVSGCNATPKSKPQADTRLKVVATTTIVGDVVHQIGGEDIELKVLLPPGSDPHSFAASPQDAILVHEAAIVFANGAGLEEFLTPLLENAGGEAEVVRLSDGLTLLQGGHEHEGGEEHEYDPHTWTSPRNVLAWIPLIEKALSEHDPAHAEAYRQRAAAYRIELETLDRWVAEQIKQIPPERRLLVTDHLAFGYLAEHYGLKQVGAAVPSFSTLAEPNAQELAALEDAIRKQGVPAIFVGSTVNPALAERIAADTGIKVVSLYTGSLTAADGPAPTYVAYIRYNITAIVEALR